MKQNRFSKLIALSIFTLVLGVGLFFGGRALAQTISTSDMGLNEIGATLGTPPTDLRLVIAKIIRAALGLLGIVALGLVLYAGFIWMTAGGNEEKITEAKKMLLNAVIGIAIILSSYAIVSFVISKLVEATTSVPGNNCLVDGTCLTNPYYPTGLFFVSDWPAGGDVCVRNFYPVIVFNRGVVVDQLLQDSITIQKSGFSPKIPGTWSHGSTDNVIIFTPDGSCQPNASNDTGTDCFEASTNYTLRINNKSGIKAIGEPDLNLSCSIKVNCNSTVSFTTGVGVDRTSPTVNIIYPVTSTPLGQGDTVQVQVAFNDDNGVQIMQLSADGNFVGSKSIQGCLQHSTTTINWPTGGIATGPHTLTATGYDWSAHVGQDSQVVDLKPQHCFDDIWQKDDVLGAGQGEILPGPPACGASCGKCGGDVCASDADCASGYCEFPTPTSTSGVCVDRAIVTKFSPPSGAPGSYVTISGFYLGDNPGRVYFSKDATTNLSSPPPDWVEARLVSCAVPVDNWTPWQILVEAPTGTTANSQIRVDTAPVTGPDSRVRQFTVLTHDGYGPYLDYFVFNNIARPSLCNILPKVQNAGGVVSLYGKNLKTLDNTNNKVLFGDTAGTVNYVISQNGPNKGLINWTDTIINEIFVPTLSPGIMSVKVVDKNGVDSNGLRFSLSAGSNLTDPVIYSISPGGAARGDYITITGANFGASIGEVYFYDATDAGHNTVYKGSLDFPAACGNSFWTPTQIIVKFHPTDGNANTNYLVRIKRAEDAKFTPFDNTRIFFLTDGLPGPGICKLDPAAGPIPLPNGTVVKVIGENFGNSPQVYFWKAAAGSTTTPVGRALATLVSSAVNSGATILSVNPANDSESGPVMAWSNSHLSNGYNFTVNDCTIKDTCSSIGASCCSNGFEKGICKPAGQLCAGGTKQSAFIWRFATKNIPAVPHVVERCDANTENGLALPSPTPNVLWDQGNQNGDHHNVCRNAVIDVEFSAALNPTSVNPNSVSVYICRKVNGNNCELYEDMASGTNKAAAKVVLDQSSFVLHSAFGGANDDTRQFLELRRNGGTTWPDRYWYQVVLSKDIISDGPSTTAMNLAVDKPCDDASSYCFVFKTDSAECKMRQVIVTPYAYWTEVLERPIKTRTVGMPSGILQYLGNGLSAQKCIMMDVNGYHWDWNASDTFYATMYPTTSTVGRTSKASALANTVAVGLTNPDNAINITAVASTNTASCLETSPACSCNNNLLTCPGKSPLTIDLSKPEVRDYWPNCQEACPNADVGAEFSVSMANVNVNWGSVRLQKCLDENCLSVINVTTTPPPNFTGTARTTLTIPHTVLSPNSFYKVILSSTSTPSLQLWSAGNLFNPMATSAPYKKEFVWRFKTKKDICLIDHANVIPAVFQAVSITDRSIYGVQPYSAPDACSASGQKLDPWSVDWNWDSSDKNVATVTEFQTKGNSPFCTNACLKKGSDVPSSAAVYIPVCGNGIVEAGEDCDGPNLANGCSLSCRWLGRSTSSTCGNAIIEPGEACDPKFNQYTNPTSSLGCTASCLNKGSSIQVGSQQISASVCGNGVLGSGEDCELGNPADPESSTSSLGCSEQCLHLGTRLSAAWCQSPARTSSGFPAVDLDKACAGAFSQCGDGQTSRDEDVGCDLGSGKHANFCNDRCLIIAPGHNKCTPGSEGCDANGQYIGSSLMYSSPSVCGDTIPGTGEDPTCEDATFIIKNHENITDPWALAIGVGHSTPTGTPPAQITNITAVTTQNTRGGAIGGSGKFVIACGFKSDADCSAVYGLDYGVGYDSCCYARPHILSVYPGSTSTLASNICPNTVIEATFDSQIDLKTVASNVFIAKGDISSTNANTLITLKPAATINSTNLTNKAPLLSWPQGVAVSGTLAYVVGYYGSLDIFDISDPAHPQILGSLGTYYPTYNSAINFIGATRILLVDKYAYIIADRSGILTVVDVGDPLHPRYVTTLNAANDTVWKAANPSLPAMNNFTYIIRVQNDYLYIADGSARSIVIINIQNRENPYHVNTISLNNTSDPGWIGNLLSLTLKDNYLYVAGTYAMDIYDVSNVTAPQWLKRASIVSASGVGAYLVNVTDMFVKGNYLYLSDNANGKAIKIIDVTNSTNPIYVSSITSTDYGLDGWRHLAILGQYAYVTTDAGSVVTSTKHGVMVIDISNPVSPVVKAAIHNTDNGLKLIQPQGIAVRGNFIYVANYSANSSAGRNFQILDASDLQLISRECALDVSNLISFADQTSRPLPWYARIWNSVVGFFRTLIGLPATAKIYNNPTRWCVGSDIGTPSVINISSTTSKISIQLNRPLDTLANYSIILGPEVRDLRGVSIGTATMAGKSVNWNWKFTTADKICTVKSVSVSPSEYIFSRANNTTTLFADALTDTGARVQPIANFYDWNYSWAPLNSDLVSVIPTTTNTNIITSQNRNGELDVLATANVIADTYSGTSGPIATGKSHITVFLCENPWPPVNYYYNQAGPFNIFPYQDRAGNIDGFNTASGTFDTSAIPPSERGNAYFNFRTYYCADNGKTGFTDDLPYLRPIVQTSTQVLVEPTFGSCEGTGNICKVDAECGSRYRTEFGSITLTESNTGICGAVTSSPKNPHLAYIVQGKGYVQCSVVGDCDTTNNSGFATWATNSVGVPTCFTFNSPARALQCFKYPALKRFLFTNDVNDDVIGIQVFSNPLHLTAAEWFQKDKQSGGQSFSGDAQTITNGVDNNSAVGDGNNVYIDALNFVTTTLSNEGDLYSNIYLVSVNSNAKPETRQIFDQLIKNLKLNINLTNYGYCGTDIENIDTKLKCNNDLDCPSSMICSMQVTKLKRDYQRLKDAKVIENALENYASLHKAAYPNLKGGSFLKGQTISTWPSWSMLGNEVSTNLPKDPVNILAPAGTCASNTAQFCTSTDSYCGTKPGTSTPDSCVMHFKETGWSTENDRNSFACNIKSLAYRYLYSTSTGFQFLLNMEDPGVLFNQQRIENFVESFDYVSSTRMGVIDSNYQNRGVCLRNEEITSVDQGDVCGDGIINWYKGEKCEPPGYTEYGACDGTNVPVRVCTKPGEASPTGNGGCQWLDQGTVPCAHTCGNAIVEPGEVCDAGRQYNGTYNNCNADCTAVSTPGLGFCGDGLLQSKYEMCDPTNELALAGKIGWCVDGLNFAMMCNVDADCGSSHPNICKHFSDTGIKYAINNNDSCNFDCQSRGPFCGNGILEPQYGEECDIALDNSCAVGGSAGAHTCDANCHFADTAPVAWWPLNDRTTVSGNTVYKDLNSGLDSVTHYSSPYSYRPMIVGGGPKPEIKWVTFFNYNPTYNNNGGGSAPFLNYLQVDDSPKLMPTSSLTIEAWVEMKDMSSESGYTRAIVVKGNTSIGEGGYALTLMRSNRFRFSVWNNQGYALGSANADSGISYPANQWVHVVAMYYHEGTNQRLKIYTNGQLDTDQINFTNQYQNALVGAAPIMSAPQLLTENNGLLYIGGVFHSSDNTSMWPRYAFSGWMSNVKIYNRPLSDAEIQDRYSNAIACNVTPPAIAAQLTPGSCGDGKVDPAEACDSGAQVNGLPCLPSYGRSCSYCASDCKNIVDIQPAQYCGNGIIEQTGTKNNAPVYEACDVNSQTGDIYAPSSYGDGVLAWWPFSDGAQGANYADFFDTTKNINASCYSPYGCPATETVSGYKFGTRVVKFDNTPNNFPNALSVEDIPELSFDKDFSVSVWIRPDQKALDTTFFSDLVSKVNGVNKFDLSLVTGATKMGWPTAPGAYAGFSVTMGNKSISVQDTSYNIPTNDWTHLVGTYSYSQITGLGTTKLYINDVLSDTTITSTVAGSVTGPLTIGGTTDLSYLLFPLFAPFYYGNIANLKLYDRELSPGDIANLYTYNRALLVSTGNVQLVHACENEYQPLFTFKKGTRQCVNNCTVLQVKETQSASCVQCGKNNISGSLVSGSVVNAIAPRNVDPLFSVDSVYHSGAGTLNLFYTPVQGQPQSIAVVNSPNDDPYTFLSSRDNSNMLLNTDPICSTGTMRYQLAVNGDYQNPFDFTIAAKPDSWQYDLILSPIISASGLKDNTGPGPIAGTMRPNDIRVVISWVKGFDLYSGFVNPDVNANPPQFDENNFLPAYGPGYIYNHAAHFQVGWFHGFNETPGLTDVESYTLDTAADFATDPDSMATKTMMFYVRTIGSNAPIVGFQQNAKLKVDVYFPDTSPGPKNLNKFVHPDRTYYLDNAAPSDNTKASYWHVFDVLRADTSPATILDVTQRIAPVQVYDAISNSNIPYPSGIIVTGPAQFR